MKNAIHSTVMASEARKDVLDGALTAQHKKQKGIVPSAGKHMCRKSLTAQLLFSARKREEK